MDPRFETTNTKYPFSLRGKEWRSIQHYVQAQKFHGTKLEETIRVSDAPEQAVSLAEESKNYVRGNWEKIAPEILYEAVLATIDQHNELRELILATEAFVGESAAALLKAQSLVRRLEPHECFVFDLYEDPEVIKRDNTLQETSEKKERARQKRNVWKDVSGNSLLEINGQNTNTVGLVGNNDLTFPISALPNNAKFVVKKYQYEKRHYKPDEEPSDEEEDEEDHRPPSPQNRKIFLADFIKSGNGISIPDFIHSAGNVLAELRNSKLNGSNIEELVEQCKTNQVQALDLIEKGEMSEEFMASMLQLLDELNTTLL